MGKASRRKRERKEDPAITEVPHFEIHAGLASAISATGPEQENKEEDKCR